MRTSETHPRHLRAPGFSQYQISIRDWPGVLTGAKSASWWGVGYWAQSGHALVRCKCLLLTQSGILMLVILQEALVPPPPDFFCGLARCIAGIALGFLLRRQRRIAFGRFSLSERRRFLGLALGLRGEFGTTRRLRG
jgi:hypothetical protein